MSSAQPRPDSPRCRRSACSRASHVAADLRDPAQRLLERLGRQPVARLAARAARVDETGLRSAARCFATAWRVTGRSAASSVAVASCRASASSRCRRFGSASAREDVGHAWTSASARSASAVPQPAAERLGDDDARSVLDLLELDDDAALVPGEREAPLRARPPRRPRAAPRRRPSGRCLRRRAPARARRRSRTTPRGAPARSGPTRPRPARHGRTISRLTSTFASSRRATHRLQIRCNCQVALYRKESAMLVPMVVESDGRYERSFDIYSRLLRERIVFLGQEVEDSIANVITAQLLFLEAEDPEQGDQALRELARRLGVRRHGDLRHDAVRQAGRAHDLHRDGHVRGGDDPRRRGAGQADGAAEREDHDPPGLRRVPRHAGRHRDSRQRGARDDAADGRDPRAPHGPALRAGDDRHRPRPLHDAGRGARVRARRRASCSRERLSR